MVQKVKKSWEKPLVYMLSIKTETMKAISNGKSETFDAKYPGYEGGPSGS